MNTISPRILQNPATGRDEAVGRPEKAWHLQPGDHLLAHLLGGDDIRVTINRHIEWVHVHRDVRHGTVLSFTDGTTYTLSPFDDIEVQ